MPTLISLCSGTGSWEKPYIDAGWKVYSVTLPDNDVRYWKLPDEPINGIIAAPPCTMFSDARTHAKTPRDLRGGMEIVEACLRIIWDVQYRIKSDQQKHSPLLFWALENPWYGRLKWFLGAPKFIFDPYEFGDMYKKRTALWGCFNDPVKTHTIKPDNKKFDMLLMDEIKKLKGVNNNDYWKDTKQRQTLRAMTPPGFAKAFYEANNGADKR